MKNLWQWEHVSSQLLLARNILEHLAHFSKLYIGFSGGLDSSVLLHILAHTPELHSKLVAIHINHALSEKSHSWQMHCQDFCRKLNIPFFSYQPDFIRHANVEEHARNARYQIFSSLLSEADALLLAHHSHDQAETLLLNLCRGTGINGMAAIPEEKKLACGTIIRPLMDTTREMLEHYATMHQLEWVEDESNEDRQFSRNFIRHEIIPLLQKRWPKVISSLNKTALYCQQAKVNLESLAHIDCQHLSSPEFDKKNRDTIKQYTILPLSDIGSLATPRLVNVLRTWFEHNAVRQPSSIIIQQLIQNVIYAKSDAKPEIQWDGIKVKRYQSVLYIMPDVKRTAIANQFWTNFPHPLLVEGAGELTAISVTNGVIISPDSKVEVRFRQGGETIFLNRQTKRLKKLFQQWKLPSWERNRVPLIYVNDQLAAIVNYAVSDHFIGNKNAFLFEIS